MLKHVLPARASTFAVLAALLLTVWTLASTAEAGSVELEVFAPKDGTLAGVEGRGWLVDLRARFDGAVDCVEAAGQVNCEIASLELTGPGVHANAAPFPGSFGTGHNPSFPSLVVLLSSRGPAASFGPGTNLSNLFNIIAVTDRTDDETEIWATWIIGAKNNFGVVGQLTPSRLFVAVVDGLAPNVVEDKNGDGIFDEKDLELMGFNVISHVVKRDFIVNGF